MSWFRLKRSMATNVSADVQDIVNTKMALNRLGYYRRPSEGYFGDWVDAELFNGIRRFQRDNGLTVDGIMRPGGPTEGTIIPG